MDLIDRVGKNCIALQRTTTISPVKKNCKLSFSCKRYDIPYIRDIHLLPVPSASYINVRENWGGGGEGSSARWD